MKAYTKSDIEHIYRQLMQRAHEHAECGKWDKAVNGIESAAEWAYNFNLFYTDADAETMLKKMVDANIRHFSIHSSDPDRCVLIDSFCLDNRGLVQQYLRAMRKCNMRILYVCTASTTSYGKGILKELRDDEKADVLLLSGGSHDVIKQVNEVASTIASFSPSSLFLHLKPWDCVALMVCHALGGVQKYNINLTDHAFWLGASFIDYNLEFRPYGMTVSLEQRNLKQNQLLPIPIYPIEPLGHQFRGIPKLPEGAIIVFTGGAVYKMLGKDDIFFRMMDVILDISPEVYILVAGFGPDKQFDDKCQSMRNGDRVIQIGIRDDIDAVFDHIDIFLATYPTTGDLMNQYAAKHGKPIIAYHDIDDAESVVEESLNHFQNHFRSYASIEDMTAYASRLIHDEAFRRSEGLVLQEGLMTEERFAEAFLTTITTHLPQWQWERDQIDYEAFFKRYLELENANGFSATKALAKQQGLSLLTTLSGFRLQALQALISYMCGAPIKELLVWLMPSFMKHQLLTKKQSV